MCLIRGLTSGNYRFIIDKQTEIIKILADGKDVGYNPREVVETCSLLSCPGIEQQKKFLDEQRATIEKSMAKTSLIEGRINESLAKAEKQRNEMRKKIESIR